MKKLLYVVLNDESISKTNSRVMDYTFYDLQTQGKGARKNILRTLKKECINYKEVKKLVFDCYGNEKEIEMY